MVINSNYMVICVNYWKNLSELNSCQWLKVAQEKCQYEEFFCRLDFSVVQL